MGAVGLPLQFGQPPAKSSGFALRGIGAEGLAFGADGFPLRAEGDPFLPNRLLIRPDGFLLRPEVRLLRQEGGPLRPDGFLIRPEGRLTRPEGFPIRPEGRLACQEGRLIRPEGFLIRPRLRLLRYGLRFRNSPLVAEVANRVQYQLDTPENAYSLWLSPLAWRSSSATRRRSSAVSCSARKASRCA